MKQRNSLFDYKIWEVEDMPKGKKILCINDGRHPGIMFVPIMKKKNFFQKILHTPLGYFTRGQLIMCVLGALMFLVLSWFFICYQRNNKQ